MIVNDDKAIAGFVFSLKKYIANGTVTPPPPIPPTVANTVKIINANDPAISNGSIGKSGLC